MNKFTLIHETPDHFVLHNGIAKFHVAKKGLGEPTADKIRSLANGGDPQTPEEAGIEAEEKTRRAPIKQTEEEKQIEKDAKPDPTDYMKYNNPDKYAEGGKLTAEDRKHIAPKNFAGPDRSYPIEDASHARNALARVSQHGSPELKAQVKAKVQAKYPGIEQSNAEGGPISVPYKKPQAYDDGGEVSSDQSGLWGSIKKAFKTPEPTPAPTPADKDEEIRRKSRLSMTDPSNPEAYAGGGPVASNAVKDISQETQKAAIGRYAAGNSANMAKGGGTHYSQGKYHFHFYDGGPVTHSDKQPEALPTPLDNYVNLADSSGDVGDEADAQNIDRTIDTGSLFNAPADTQTPLQKQMAEAEAEEHPSPEESANNLSRAAGEPLPFPPSAPAPSGTVDPGQQIALSPKTKAAAAEAPPTEPLDATKELEKAAVAPVQTSPPDDLLGQLHQTQQLEQGATAAGALNQADFYKKQAQLLGNEYDYKANEYHEYQVQQMDNEKQLDTLASNVAAGKIDPNRYWNDKSTGGKILASIGLILGGIGGGANRTNVNVVQEQMNQAIKNDIDAQKENQGVDVNLYKIGLNKYKNAQAAYSFALMNHAAMTAGQIEQLAAKSNSQQVKLAAIQAVQGLKQTAMQQNMQLSMHQVALQMAQGGGGQGINPEMLPQEMRERSVQLPGGGLGLAKSKESADLAQKELTSYSNIGGGINKAINLLQTRGRNYNPLGTDKAVADSARNDIITELNHLHDLNRLNETEWKAYSSQVPSPGDWLQGKALAKLQTLQQNVNNKIENTKANYLEGYRPAPKFTPGPPKIR